MQAARDPDRPTGVYFKQRTGGTTTMLYYRAGSAASALAPEDVPDEAFDGVDLVHLTGITTALGQGPRELVHDVARRARERGITVLLDPNYRPALWMASRRPPRRFRGRTGCCAGSTRATCSSGRIRRMHWQRRSEPTSPFGSASAVRS